MQRHLVFDPCFTVLWNCQNHACSCARRFGVSSTFRRMATLQLQLTEWSHVQDTEAVYPDLPVWSPRPKPQTARPVVTKTIHVQDTEAVYPDLPVWSPRPKPQTARPEVIETKTTDRKTCGHQDQNHRQQDLWSPRPKTRQYSTDVKKLCHCFMHIILVLLC